MTRADPLVTGVLGDLARGLRALDLLDGAPRRMPKVFDLFRWFRLAAAF